MTAQAPVLRSHTAVLASIIVAAVAVAGCAVVAIAYMLGLVGPHAPLPISTASPAQQVAGTAPGVLLLPGETLVTPEIEAQAARQAASSMPQNSPSPPEPQAAPARPTPRPQLTPRASTAPAPVTPSYARAAPLVSPEPATPRAPAEAPAPDGRCTGCGTVVSTSPAGDQWEVRVQFDDGTARLLMYPTPPSFRNGQKVRFEDGRLLTRVR